MKKVINWMILSLALLPQFVMAQTNWPGSNQPPIVTITSPVNGSVFNAPANISIAATALDSDGSVSRVDFYAGSTLIGSRFPTPIKFALGMMTNNFEEPEGDAGIKGAALMMPSKIGVSMVWSNAPIGSHLLQAIAFDNRGARGYSWPIQITVRSPLSNSFPIVTIRATIPSTSETGPTPGRFTLYRTGSPFTTLPVYYKVGGTAKWNMDYSGVNAGLVYFQFGQASVDIPVIPVNDSEVEQTETVSLTLSPSMAYQVGSPSSATVTILDNDLPPANQPPVVNLLSPANGAVFAAHDNITFQVQAFDPDGRVVGLQFFANSNLVGMITNVLNNSNLVQFVWANVAAGDFALRARAIDNQGAVDFSPPVNIHVQSPTNDIPTLSVVATDASASEAGLDGAQFAITRAGAASRGVAVNYSISGTARNGSDYIIPIVPLSLAPGQTALNIYVNTQDDNEMEGTETIVFTLLPSGEYQLGMANNAIVYIADNDVMTSNQAPRISIVSPTNGSMFTAPASLTVEMEVIDPDGYATQVELFEGANRIGESSVTFSNAPLPGTKIDFLVPWPNVGPGNYSLTAKAIDNRGAEGQSLPVLVSVLNAPTNLIAPVIVRQPASQTVSSGSSNVIFSVQATGSAPLQYQWRFNGANISGATSATLWLANVTTNNAGTYDVIVRNSAGSATSAPATLTVLTPPALTPPAITRQPVSLTVSIGASNAYFNVQATGSAPLQYQWRFNSVDIPGATAATLWLANVTTNNAGTYDVIVRNPAGSVISAPATLTVLPPPAPTPPTITRQPSSLTVPVGATNAVFSIQATGTAPLQYQWRFNGTDLPDKTTATCLIYPVTAAKAGAYDCLVKNSAGMARSDTVTLTIVEP